MICENVKLTGRVEVLVIDTVSGAVDNSFSLNNLIVDAGKNFFARITGDPSFTSTIRQIAMGKGTLPATASDTNLGNPLVAPTDVNNAAYAIAPVTRSTPTSKMAKFVATFPGGGGGLVTTSALISEIILIFDSSDRTYTSGTPISFTGNGGVFARLGGFAPFSKSASQQVVISWYTQTEYAFVAGQECQTCCDKVVVQLPDAPTNPIDLSGNASIFELRTLTQNTAFQVPTPAPPDGRVIEFRIRAQGGNWNLGWPVNFSGTTYPLPVRASGDNELDRVFFEYNVYTGKWDCVGVDLYANYIRGKSSVVDPIGLGSGEHSIVIGDNISNVMSYGNTSIGYYINIGDPSNLFGCGYNLVMGHFAPGTCQIGTTGGGTIGNTVILPNGGVALMNGSIGSFLAGGSSMAIGDGVNRSVCIGDGIVVGNCSDTILIGTSAYSENYNDVIGIGRLTAVIGESNIAIGAFTNIGSIGTPSVSCIAIGYGATINAGITGSQAYGTGATSTINNQVVFGSTFSGIDNFTTVSNQVGDPSLFAFDAASIVANHDSAFYLLYKNALGNVVSLQVKVDPVTGALTVPL